MENKQRWHRRRFFKLVWEDLTIYGYEDDSPYEEDHEIIDRNLSNGIIDGQWFSEACPEGEGGEQSLERLMPITEKEFEEAVASFQAN